MSVVKYRGSGKVLSSDFKEVSFVGKTKGGQSITIKIDDAINLGNLSWAFEEKNDTVDEIVFTGTYDNTDDTASSTAEPWHVEISNAPSTNSGSIMLGTGIFYVGSTAVGLTRGGSKFDVEREYREINADGDRGPVKDRIVMEKSVCKLSVKALTILNRLADLYNGIETEV